MRVGSPIEVVEVEAVNTPSGRKSFRETEMNQNPGLEAGVAHFVCLKQSSSVTSIIHTSFIKLGRLLGGDFYLS